MIIISVIKSKRTLSDLEFYHNAIKIDKEITALLLKDFGIRDKVREVKYFCDIKKLDSEDKEMFLKIVDKYNMTEKVIESYPIWLIEHYRKSILYDLDKMFRDITNANTIFPLSIQEFEEKRRLQTAAISDCQNILHTMNRIINTLPVNANKLMRYVDMLDYEIKLLRGWRKSCNKVLKQLKGSIGPATQQ